jgi:hypothetical protein
MSTRRGLTSIRLAVLASQNCWLERFAYFGSVLGKTAAVLLEIDKVLKSDPSQETEWD